MRAGGSARPAAPSHGNPKFRAGYRKVAPPHSTCGRGRPESRPPARPYLSELPEPALTAESTLTAEPALNRQAKPRAVAVEP